MSSWGLSRRPMTPWSSSTRIFSGGRQNAAPRAETESESALRRSDTYYTRWSHQVKTPLAALRLLIREEPIDRTACENELLKTEQYVEMALQYQRLKSTENDLLLTSCPLDRVVRNTVKSLAPLFIARNLSLEIENMSVSVLTDEKWLQFALEQILSNAAKYTRQGGVTIRLSDPSRPELVIQDSGIGIQPEDLPRVTDWGYTGQNGHSGTRSTGIGLALCPGNPGDAGSPDAHQVHSRSRNQRISGLLPE